MSQLASEPTPDDEGVAVTFHHAAERRVVRLLSDGRTARLVFAAKTGDAARVQLPSGAFIDTHRSNLELIDG